MIAHFTGEPFQITQRHYDVILKQAHDNLPKETGGFLGGHGRFIKGILPLFNMHLGNKTDTFAYTQEDAVRSRQFFEKNGLEYLGVYHTHPKGTAEPSKQDLSHIQKYMFIISMRNIRHPDFACYEVQGMTYNRVTLDVSTESIEVADIHSRKKGTSKKETSLFQPQRPSLELGNASKQLDGLFDAIIKDDVVEYPRYEPFIDDEESFSTFA